MEKLVKLMKKKNGININVKILMAFIFGIIISTSLSYVLAETLIKSEDVYFDKTSSGLAVNNVQAAIDGTCTKFSNELNNFLNKIYPIGSIYISTASTNPSTFLGGTWENYGNGRVLRGINSGTAGATGGSDTVSLKEENLPAHTHTYDKVNANTESHILTIAEMPAHDHNVGGNVNGYWMYGGSKNLAGGNTAWGRVTAGVGMQGGGQGHTHPILTTSTNTGSTGSTTPTAINVQNPYITVYMWRRIK